MYLLEDDCKQWYLVAHSLFCGRTKNWSDEPSCWDWMVGLELICLRMMGEGTKSLYLSAALYFLS